jgi:hypothetical protein
MMHAPLTCPTCGAPSRPLAMVAHIQATVAGYYRLRATDIVSHRRDREVAWPRQVAMYLSRELTPKSLPAIATRFQRDHTTIIHGCRAVERRMADDAELRMDLEVLRERLRPVDMVENSQILSKSLPEYGKEHTGNGQEETATA